MKYLYSLFFCLIFTHCYAAERLIQCKVIGISDGDTFTCLFDRTSIKVRLQHIDAPESGQPYGNKAKQALANLIFKQNVTLHSTGYDRYQRLLAVVYNQKGENINLTLVKQGMAWAYQKTQPLYLDAEKQAKTAKIGLWQDPKAINPADWRKYHIALPPIQAVEKGEKFTNPQKQLNCQIKLSCNKIGNYELAEKYFRQCGWKELDGNNDGIPCNKLYREAQKNKLIR